MIVVSNVECDCTNVECILYESNVEYEWDSTNVECILCESNVEYECSLSCRMWQY